MFRPFIGQPLQNCNNRPHKICLEATQCLLVLVQAYEDLFSFERVSGLIPYFVCTAGLFGLAMEESGSAMSPVKLRIDNEDSQLYDLERTGHESTGEMHGRVKKTSYVEISAVAHAHLLLAKMCSSHSAAVVAERILQEAVSDRQSPSLC